MVHGRGVELLHFLNRPACLLLSNEIPKMEAFKSRLPRIHMTLGPSSPSARDHYQFLPCRWAAASMQVIYWTSCSPSHLPPVFWSRRRPALSCYLVRAKYPTRYQQRSPDSRSTKRVIALRVISVTVFDAKDVNIPRSNNSNGVKRCLGLLERRKSSQSLLRGWRDRRVLQRRQQQCHDSGRKEPA